MQPKYVQDRYEESRQFLDVRKRRQVSQLVLLNNLQRGDQNIASTLLLTLFNRLLSSLYDDKLQIKFLPSQGILQEQINSYNLLAQNDYLEMGKAQIDYDWVWDTLFFGRGYLETLRFNKERKIMEPHVINPLVFGYDPYFEDPQEWRYYWKWITKSKWEIERLIKNGKITGIKKTTDIPSGVESQLWEYKLRRDKAKLAVEPAGDTIDGDVFQILEFFGHDEKTGKKTVYWFDKGIDKMMMSEELDLGDGEDGESKWPIVVKEAFREPHSSIVFSVADLLEDKHRAKSVLLNLAFIAAKDRANPIYGYNPDKVKDVSQFFSRQINQHIPMDDPESAWPMNTEDPMSVGLLNFIQVLTQEADAPVGTGQTLQPEQGGQETATEVAIEQQMNDISQSLQSKIMQFGEAEFWGAWFHRYQKNASSIETKMANIVGVSGVDSHIIDMKDFDTKYPPGVLVYSAKEAEFKNLVKRRDMMQLYPNLMQSMSPSGFKNFNKHVFFPLMLEDPSLIDTIYPKSLDEMKAEEENQMLAKNEYPEVLDTEDHETHIYIHRQLMPKTWSTWFHIREHEEKLTEQLAQQQAQEQQMVETQSPSGQSSQGQNQIGADKQSPMEATAPLKTEAVADNQKSL